MNSKILIRYSCILAGLLAALLKDHVPQELTAAFLAGFTYSLTAPTDVKQKDIAQIIQSVEGSTVKSGDM